MFNESVRAQKIKSLWLARIPQTISERLPSRGMVMITGYLNEVAFTAPLEPDGKKGHFLPLDGTLAEQLKLREGDSLTLEFEPTDAWPEPELPEDIRAALADEGLDPAWETLTVKARWEWLRWIRATKSEKTRAKRIGVAVSKLKQGDQRPCCFNSASCTIPELAKGGVLQESEADPE